MTKKGCNSPQKISLHVFWCADERPSIFLSVSSWRMVVVVGAARGSRVIFGFPSQFTPSSTRRFFIIIITDHHHHRPAGGSFCKLITVHSSSETPPLIAAAGPRRDPAVLHFDPLGAAESHCSSPCRSRRRRCPPSRSPSQLSASLPWS